MRALKGAGAHAHALASGGLNTGGGRRYAVIARSTQFFVCGTGKAGSRADIAVSHLRALIDRQTGSVTGTTDTRDLARGALGLHNLAQDLRRIAAAGDDAAARNAGHFGRCDAQRLASGLSATQAARHTGVATTDVLPPVAMAFPAPPKAVAIPEPPLAVAFPEPPLAVALAEPPVAPLTDVVPPQAEKNNSPAPAKVMRRISGLYGTLLCVAKRGRARIAVSFVVTARKRA